MQLLTTRLLKTITAGRMFHFPQRGKGGGVSSVSKEALRCYIAKLLKHCTKSVTPLIPEVESLRLAIYSDPVIRMTLQGSLDILTQQANCDVPLTNCSIQDVLQQINYVATHTAQYEDKQIIGVPFSILFFGLLNNYYGQGFFGNPSVNKHLKSIFNAYGRLLKSPESQASLNQKNGWLCPEAQKWVDYKDFVHDPRDPFFGYKNWNAWFTRSLLPNARPIDKAVDRIVHSSDSYCLESPQQPVYGVKGTDKFWLKDDSYSLHDIFNSYGQGKEIVDIVNESFVGGTVYQAFLSPWCYHWWHAPYAGTIEKTYKVQGTYLLEKPTSNLSQSGEDNYVNTQPMLTCLSARQVYIINTHNPNIGRIGVVEIGMGEVSSCVSEHFQVGQSITKGQILGRFEFGGSSHAIIFDKKAKLFFNPKIREVDPNGDPALQKVGEWLCQVVQAN